MAQIFHPSTNTVARVTIFGALFFVAAVAWVWGVVIRSPWASEVDVVRDQPVQFSHRHHVAGLGIDCRFCHTSVEQSAFAGIPPTETCMKCHAHVWADAPFLAPVRESWDSGRPLAWTRVHDLPDFVYFHHAAHLDKGVGCASCHGRVDRMPMTWRERPLTMEWCLECHRDPVPSLRPRDQVFSMDWTPPDDGGALQRELARTYGVRARTECNACHR